MISEPYCRYIFLWNYLNASFQVCLLYNENNCWTLILLRAYVASYDQTVKFVFLNPSFNRKDLLFRCVYCKTLEKPHWVKFSWFEALNLSEIFHFSRFRGCVILGSIQILLKIPQQFCLTFIKFLLKQTVEIFLNHFLSFIFVSILRQRKILELTCILVPIRNYREGTKHSIPLHCIRPIQQLKKEDTKKASFRYVRKARVAYVQVDHVRVGRLRVWQF